MRRDSVIEVFRDILDVLRAIRVQMVEAFAIPPVHADDLEIVAVFAGEASEDAGENPAPACGDVVFVLHALLEFGACERFVGVVEDVDEGFLSGRESGEEVAGWGFGRVRGGYLFFLSIVSGCTFWYSVDVCAIAERELHNVESDVFGDFALEFDAFSGQLDCDGHGRYLCLRMRKYCRHGGVGGGGGLCIKDQ